MTLNKKYLKKNFNIYLASTAIMLAIGIIFTNNTKVVNNEEVVVNNSEKQEYPIDTVNDGVYTNYEYGFTFEYPEDVFNKFENHREYGGLVSDRYISSNNNQKSYDIWLNIEVGYDQAYTDKFNKEKEIKIGKLQYKNDYLNSIPKNVWPLFNNRKIKDLNVFNHEGFILYSYPLDNIDAGIEPSYGHVLSVNKDNAIITISIYSKSSVNKKNQLVMINDISKTLKFFDPNTSNLEQ